MSDAMKMRNHIGFSHEAYPQQKSRAGHRFLSPAAKARVPRFKAPAHWPLQRRLDHYSIPEPNSGCRLWDGKRDWNGYGTIAYRNKAWMAHRAAWTCAHGPIPPGLIVCHRCDVRACINPAHLFLGTHADNMADMMAKRRIRRPTSPHFAPQIVEETVKAIRSAPGPQREIAARYGISQTQVSKIKLKRSWACI